jgi:threonine aldolase
VVAQQAALRVWTERVGRQIMALHPKSHIAADEAHAYVRLQHLIGLPVGQDWAPFTVEDLTALAEPLGAITVELPLRRAGFKLPAWAELEAIAAWAREQAVPLHFDGARLWEATPFYGRPHAEIAALADSIYVSFYKGLGGLAGCILAGPADFIAAARIWQTRLGGNLYTVFPYVLAASEGLHHHLPKMAGYWARAREVAAALVAELGLRVAPDPPQTNGFQVYFPHPAAALEAAARTLAQQEQVWVLDRVQETGIPGMSMAEVQIGGAAEAWTTAEIVAAFRCLLEFAAGG